MAKAPLQPRMKRLVRRRNLPHHAGDDSPGWPWLQSAAAWRRPYITGWGNSGGRRRIDIVLDEGQVHPVRSVVSHFDHQVRLKLPLHHEIPLEHIIPLGILLN